ncbi:MAG: myo-inositol catabolism protein IolH [Roseibacillus sp.]|jgi:sugar phosphate isomerase/epimerase|nr:myo-inositol catabolism protein IolH [Roseibacillus sp.]MBP34313.1 myo-inositol catabolism protein IolH [Roseibacillus sp.]MCP4730026.1 TIM barrel protein [Roseibacillus sp.]MDP6208672.1 sugar phosphate isomerase/epimerase family protein [Roseibacillus sp.]MDP7306828.1 sugar phosphate isomerase/epimerase family protein [Roseibacillus sp.]|tara:strand:+ start:3263 stop:4144 length:882 start_codon:yes stop_codon:yes gene_type:complete
MPKLATFPKAELEALVDGSMRLSDYLAFASGLDVDGVELYPLIVDLEDPGTWNNYRHACREMGLEIPMLCCSPDFTHPDPAFRAQEIEKEKRWIEMSNALGARFCRVLSGQRRPEVSREEGIELAATSIQACLPFAAEHGVTLVLENHYKDGFWDYPEFAQPMDIFCDLVEAVGEHPAFGVNYDPSNTILAGEDPLELLARVKDRVVTMHASDRYLKHGTLEDLAREEGVTGYAERLAHGEIGQGMNDYDAIFATLSSTGFDGWISIEDGVDGPEQLERSVAFLRTKMMEHFP